MDLFSGIAIKAVGFTSPCFFNWEKMKVEGCWGLGCQIRAIPTFLFCIDNYG